MRKLATVRRIETIEPIPKADAIEVATVGGWKSVVKKGEFTVGNLAVYLEVDSWVPSELAPFLSNGKEPRVYNGVKGERLRTIKLRGQLSQGLILPISVAYDTKPSEFVEGDDVTELLGIQKWERPVPAQLAGIMKGDFHPRVPKTDQERVQNLVNEVASARAQDLPFEVTEKLEGSSITIYLIDGEFGVCSRNIDLKETEGNAYWEIARRYNLEEKMRAYGTDIAIQGELCGPGIQSNIYNLPTTDMYVYDVYNVQSGVYVKPGPRRRIVEEFDLKHVPVLSASLGLDTVENLLKLADGKSCLHDTLREGIVFKQIDGGMTFKAVSNQYLLKHGD